MQMDRGDNEEEKADVSRQDGASWGAWGAWGQQWIDSVKEKSTETLQMVKKDLNEFVEVIQGDTAEKLSETASKLGENEPEQDEVSKGSTTKIMKQGISKILHSVSELMTVEPNDSAEEVITLSEDRSVSQYYNRKQEKLQAIQMDPGTYCNEPEAPFEDWLQMFDLDEQKLQMSDLLIQNSAVRAIYTQLVPNVISHTTFWQRYFFRLFLLDREEQKRNDILARANASTTKDDDSTDGWGDDDDEEDIEILLQNPYTEEKNIANDISKLTIEEAILQSQNQDKLRQDKNVESNQELIVEKEGHSEIENKQESFSEETVQCDENDANEVNKNISEKNVESEKPFTEQKQETIDAVSSKVLDKSHETISSDNDFVNTKEKTPPKLEKSVNEAHSSPKKVSPPAKRIEISETSSVSSWMSIDDEMKVKMIKEAQVIEPDNRKNSEEKTSDSSSGVLINKSDADDLDDFDLDLEDDVNDEELQKIVQEIKEKATTDDLKDIDDDDWENWE